MIKDFFKLAYNSVRNRQLRSWLTMLGVFVGIAAVVSLISLGQGLQSSIEGEFSSLGTDKLFVQAKGSAFGPPGTATPSVITDNDKEIVKESRGVKRVASRLIRSAQIEFDNNVVYQYVGSMPDDKDERDLVIEVFDPEFVSGDMINPKDERKVVIGNNYATKKKFGSNVKIGDKLKIQGKEFKVAGILKRYGNFELDDIVLMNEETMREIYNLKDQIDILVVQTLPGSDPGTVADNLRRDLRNFRNVDEGKEDFDIQTPEDILKTVNNVLLVLQVVLIGIAAISLLVGGIGIMNTMYTSVLERTKEIGIMKSIGAKNSDILTIFLIESGFYGLAGGVIGVILGLGVSFGVGKIASIALGSDLFKASFSPYLVVGALAFAFLVGCASGVLPSMQASRLKPVDALRYS